MDPALKADSVETRLYRSRTAAERRIERRSRLIEAATEAFSRDSYRSTSIEQLCSMAEISARNFYEEFASKEALLHVLYDDLNTRAFQAAATALAETDPMDLLARAQAGVTGYLRTMTADWRLAKIAHIESVGVSTDMEAHRQAALDAFAGLIRQEAERMANAGLAPKRDFSLTAIALVGAIRELAVAAARVDIESPPSLERVTTEATRLLVTAIMHSMG